MAFRRVMRSASATHVRCEVMFDALFEEVTDGLIRIAIVRFVPEQ
jgi:hypothetical protein